MQTNVNPLSIAYENGQKLKTIVNGHYSNWIDLILFYVPLQLIYGYVETDNINGDDIDKNPVL